MSQAFLDAVDELAADLPLNRLYLPAIVQAGAQAAIEEIFSAAGGIFNELPVEEGGDYADLAANCVSVVAEEATNPDPASAAFARVVSLKVELRTSRDVEFATAARIFGALLLLLQATNFKAALAEAIAEDHPLLAVRSVREIGEAADVGDKGRILAKTLQVGIGQTV